MKVECIKPFGDHQVGDLVEVPDGASVDPVHYRPVVEVPAGTAAADAALEAAKAALGDLAGRIVTPKEGM